MSIDLEKSNKDVKYKTLSGGQVQIERDKGDTWRGEITFFNGTAGRRVLYNVCGITIDPELRNHNLDPENWELAMKLAEIEKHQCPEPLFPSMNLPRPVILWMAGKMEEKLSDNDYKGGWDSYTPDWLFERLLKEMAELYNAMIRYQNERDYEKIIYEAADINNFSLMIADVINKKFNKGKNAENNTRSENT
jgi:hypothetical protein